MQLNEKDIELFIFTEREGALSPVGHDLKLAATSLKADVGERVKVQVASDSLKVVASITKSGEEKVSLMDRKVIDHNTAKDVLQAKKHRFVEFEGTVEANDDGFWLKGELTLLGQSKPLSLQFRADGSDWVSEVTFDQRDWGMKPYTAFMGALKIKPELRVAVRLPAKAYSP